MFFSRFYKGWGTERRVRIGPEQDLKLLPFATANTVATKSEAAATAA